MRCCRPNCYRVGRELAGRLPLCETHWALYRLRVRAVGQPAALLELTEERERRLEEQRLRAKLREDTPCS